MLAPPQRNRRARRRISLAARRQWHREIQRARRHPAAFAEYVFDLKLDPVQLEWFEYWLRYPATVLHAGVGMGKSMLVRALALWLIGRDPTVQIIWISATQRQPKKHLHSLATLIEAEGVRSRLHHVFPAMRPGDVWRSTEVSVEREVSPSEADPTIQVYGAYSDSLLGSRATVLVMDDLCNFTNTLTEEGRTKMIEWLATVLSRLTKPDVRMIVIGNFWHELDATRDLARNKGFQYRKYPAFTRDPETGEIVPTAPAAMTKRVIEDMIKRLGPRRARQMLECEAPDTELGRFKGVWFDKALAVGRGREFRPRKSFKTCFTGVDLGHTGAPGYDRTAIVTAVLMADGRKEIIDVRSGTWSGPEIKRQLVDVKMRYNPTIGVESNGAQRVVMELITDDTAIPLTDHHTGINKRDLVNGVEGLAFTLSEGSWIFPSPEDPTLDKRHGLVESDGVTAGQPHEELQALIGEALTYDPTRPKEHTGDRLMAWWICSETIRKSAVAAYDDIMSAIDAPSLDMFSR